MGSKKVEVTGSTYYQMKDRKGKPWRGEIRYRTPDGKLHRATKTFDADSVKSKTAAKNALSAWMNELVEKLNAELKDATENAEPLTVWQCVDEYIESSLQQGLIEASTATDYRYTARRIRATLPDMPLDELTPDLLNKWQTSLAQKQEDRPAYVHSTVKKTRNVLRCAIQEAIKNGRTTLRTNPVNTTRKTIAQKRIARATAPKMNALDEDNRSTLLDELDRMADTPVSIAARIAIYAGLREAEISALLWSDVDLDEGFIIVDKAIGKVDKAISKSDATLYIKPQKNDCDEREIPICAELDTVLRRWQEKQGTTAEAVGIKLEDTFVIGDPTIVPPAECFDYLEVTNRDMQDGRLLGNVIYPAGTYQPARLSREWRTIARSSMARGMLGKPVTFHNLRHSFAFHNANSRGIELEQLSLWMGHGDTTTTAQFYVRRDKKAERARSRAAMDGMAD